MLDRLTRRYKRTWMLRIVAILLFALLVYRYCTDASQSHQRESNFPVENFSRPTESFPGSTTRDLEKIPIKGFTNLGLQDDFNCADLTVFGKLDVSQAFDVDDDLLEIAASIKHPLVNYDSQGKGLSYTELIRRTWSRMGGSSVWLEEHQVFLTVSRVYFYDKGVPKWSIISFMRAQIHDAEWNHLSNYQLHWQGETFVFPRTFEVDIPYKIGGCFCGPEDPRIILERGVKDAEPVIVFNMQETSHSTRRAMYAYRPFSNFTTILELEIPQFAEKNWAPFFLERNISPRGQRQPSNWLHFVYEFQPLSIVRCYLPRGKCTRIFEQHIPSSFKTQHRYDDGVLRGGSNFEPLYIDGRPGIISFIGFPRTHIDEGCLEKGQQREDMAMYRPEMTILSTDGTSFWFDYSSENLNFGSSFLRLDEKRDPCTAGRVLLVNSIAYFDTSPKRDEMAVTFSVNDVTVRGASIRGVHRLVQSLPQFRPRTWRNTHIPASMDVTHRVAGCSIEAATDYALAQIAD